MIFTPRPVAPAPVGSPDFVSVDPVAATLHWSQAMPDRPDCRRLVEKNRRLARMAQRARKDRSKREGEWA